VAARDRFVLEQRPSWDELERLLAGGSLHKRSGPEIGRAAALYRVACTDLMHARSAELGTDVTGYLDGLVSRGHSSLYGPRPYSYRRAIDALLVQFPRTFRRHLGYFVVAAALFLVPLVAALALAASSEQFAFDVMSREALQGAEATFAKGFAGGRDEGADSAMAGFYVNNNVGIAFRCFATGILFGSGSVFFLFYNGLSIGAVTGFVIRNGAGRHMLTFMCGHAPFELTAIVISGAAGLMLGAALIAPGELTRWGAIRAVSEPVGHLVLGAAALLLLAAVIEGFWSPSAIAQEVKWAFFGLAAIATSAFLAFAGRRAT
jgi:uncharacterized membrane protein SpoIIM required for sporulation